MKFGLRKKFLVPGNPFGYDAHPMRIHKTTGIALLAAFVVMSVSTPAFAEKITLLQHLKEVSKIL